jgi:DNA-binding beta-propeller fold protein YncE
VAELPPPAGPDRSPPLTEKPAGRVIPIGHRRPPEAGEVAAVNGGRNVAVLAPRDRTLTVYEGTRVVGRVPAGVGPTRVVAGPGRLIYVVDTTGDGLLVFELRPRLHLTRRLPLLGSPYGIATPPGRVWVTLTAANRLVELADGARPHRLRSFPAVRQPDAVAVLGDRVYVSGRADGVLQIVDARDTGRPTRRTAPR